MQPKRIPPTDTLTLSDREFGLFRNMIFRVAGIHMTDAKRPLVSGRLGKRVRQLGMASYGQYFDCLQADPNELQIAVDLLTTNETYFFREPKHFDFLRETILPELRNRNSVRIWSGACSTGEEPYTLAMTLAESLGGRAWEIMASDISTRVLETARAGIYPEEDGSGIPRHLLRKHCLKGTGSHEGSFMIDPALRQRIQFKQVNLNEPLPALGEFDVIFLRNVMIYFNQETKREVMQRMVAKLRPGGWFIVSHSESLNGVTDTLKLVKPSIYRKPHD